MAQGLTDSKHYEDIAAAIRAKKGTTAVFTPEQMAVEIEGIVTADGLPRAENMVFGTPDTHPDSAQAMTSIVNEAHTEMSGKQYNAGWKFTAKEAIPFCGFRIYHVEKNVFTCRLYRVSTQEVLAIADATIEETFTWNSYYLDASVVLTAGESYIVAFTSADTSYQNLPCFNGTVTWDSRIEEISAVGAKYGAYPSTAFPNQPAVDFYLGNPVEDFVAESLIQTNTLTVLIDAVNEKVGSSGEKSLAQTIEAVQNLDTAESVLSSLIFDSTAVGELPIVYDSTGNSTLSGINFASSAVGALVDEKE